MCDKFQILFNFKNIPFFLASRLGRTELLKNKSICGDKYILYIIMNSIGEH